MEKIIEYISFGITAASTIFAGIMYLKNRKKGKTAAEKEEELSKYKNIVELAKIVQKIPELIIRAEKLFPSTDTAKYGTAKLEYVLKELQILCIQKSVEYQEEALVYEIEKVLSTPTKTKEVYACVENE